MIYEILLKSTDSRLTRYWLLKFGGIDLNPMTCLYYQRPSNQKKQVLSNKQRDDEEFGWLDGDLIEIWMQLLKIRKVIHGTKIWKISWIQMYKGEFPRIFEVISSFLRITFTSEFNKKKRFSILALNIGDLTAIKSPIGYLVFLVTFPLIKIRWGILEEYSPLNSPMNNICQWWLIKIAVK